MIPKVGLLINGHVKRQSAETRLPLSLPIARSLSTLTLWSFVEPWSSLKANWRHSFERLPTSAIRVTGSKAYTERFCTLSFPHFSALSLWRAVRYRLQLFWQTVVVGSSSGKSNRQSICFSVRAHFLFCKHKSTEHAPLTQKELLLSNIERKLFTISISTVFIKAFYNINHKIQFDNLEHYGVPRHVLHFFKSHLENPKHYVNAKEHSSTIKLLRNGALYHKKVYLGLSCLLFI